MTGYNFAYTFEDDSYYEMVARDIISKAIFANGEKGCIPIYIYCPSAKVRSDLKYAIIEIYQDIPAWIGGIQSYGGIEHSTPYFNITYDCPEYPADKNPDSHFFDRVFIWDEEMTEFEIWDDYTYGK